MIENTVINVDNISKKFKIGSQRKQNMLAHLATLVSGVEPKQNFWVLQNLSLTVKRQEIIGLVGPNGSGKTTLLKIIAGIYQPSSGKIKIKGKAILLSNLSTTLKLRLTVKDNIFLIGSILGLSQANIKKIFNQLIEFAQLQHFIETKVYQLSSGLKQRLVFSIITHSLSCADYDILLLDEVFSGNEDQEFKNKGLKKLEEIIKKEVTVIIVSHDSKIIEKYCQRVVRLKNGRIE